MSVDGIVCEDSTANVVRILLKPGLSSSAHVTKP